VIHHLGGVARSSIRFARGRCGQTHGLDRAAQERNAPRQLERESSMVHLTLDPRHPAGRRSNAVPARWLSLLQLIPYRGELRIRRLEVTREPIRLEVPIREDRQGQHAQQDDPQDHPTPEAAAPATRFVAS
jgi:hypothetical protein